MTILIKKRNKTVPIPFNDKLSPKAVDYNIFSKVEDQKNRRYRLNYTSLKLLELEIHTYLYTRSTPLTEHSGDRFHGRALVKNASGQQEPLNSTEQQC